MGVDPLGLEWVKIGDGIKIFRQECDKNGKVLEAGFTDAQIATIKAIIVNQFSKLEGVGDFIVEMLKKQNSKDPYTGEKFFYKINYTTGNPSALIHDKGVAWINPKSTLEVLVEDKSGKRKFEPFDIQRQLAHELGHAYYGVGDDYDPTKPLDSKNGMTMVNMSENPLMQAVGRGRRINYGGYRNGKLVNE
jgi:hypothetical protein